MRQCCAMLVPAGGAAERGQKPRVTRSGAAAHSPAARATSLAKRPGGASASRSSPRGTRESGGVFMASPIMTMLPPSSGACGWVCAHGKAARWGSAARGECRRVARLNWGGDRAARRRRTHPLRARRHAERPAGAGASRSSPRGTMIKSGSFMVLQITTMVPSGLSTQSTRAPPLTAAAVRAGGGSCTTAHCQGLRRVAARNGRARARS